jgi:hypothetical protein
MPSFIYFNMEELRKSLENLIEINKTIDFKNDDSFHEDINILRLAIECVNEYQELILKIASECAVGGDIEHTVKDGLNTLIISSKN